MKIFRIGNWTFREDMQMSNAEIDRVYKKHLTPAEIKKLKKKVNGVHTKKLGSRSSRPDVSGSSGSD